MAKPQIRRSYAAIPTLLGRLRSEAGLTQRQLAAGLGVPQNTIHRMECGTRRCDALELIEWAEACGADPADAFQRLLEATSWRKPRKPKSTP